jgi:hypothetical protein
MPSLGLIEGFYGRSWNLSERQSLLARLNALKFQRYCYAPKSDSLLRKDWQHLYAKDNFAELLQLREYSAKQNIQFEVGFSPLGLVDDWHEQSRKILKAKLAQLNELNLDGINILFDDMTSNCLQLAKIQSEIAIFIAEFFPDAAINICPSYYSFDPILEEVFGAMPENYLVDFGELMPQAFGVFWTGDKVISESYPQASIDKAASLLKRAPMLWDNSLANDGKKTSPYLKFKPMAIKQAELPKNISGIYFNPMNQAAIAEQVLGSFFAEDTISFAQLLDIPLESFKQLLLRFENELQHRALDEIEPLIKKDIYDLFTAYPEQALARNICDWLDGQFIFDPECLT